MVVFFHLGRDGEVCIIVFCFNCMWRVFIYIVAIAYTI